MRKRKSDDAGNHGADGELLHATDELERRNIALEHLLHEQEDSRAAILHMLDDLERERRLIEQVRREWVTAIDAVRDPIFIHDKELRVVRANRAYAERAGLDIHEVIGKPFWQMFPKLDAAPSGCALEQRQETQEELRLPSGEEFISRAYPIHGPEGQHISSLHILTDVTEQRRVEAEQRILSEAMRQTSEAVVVLDRDMRITYLNPAFYRLFGYVPGEILGQPIAVLSVPGQADELQPSEIVRRLRKIKQWRGEVRRLAKDGTAIPVLLTAAAISDGRGEIAGYVGTFLDLREIRQAELALRESEEKFRSISVAAVDAVLMLDEDGRIAYWNPAAERIFGYSPEQALGQDMHLLLVPHRYLADARRGWARFRETGEGPVIGKVRELEARHRDGKEFPVELSVSALKLKDRWHAVGILRDISERKRAEAAVRASEQYLHTIIDTEPECIKLVGADQRLIEMNAAGLAMIEADSLEQVAGSTLDNLVVPEYRAAFRNFTRSVIQGNKEILAFEILGLKGTRRWLETHAVPMTTPTGETVLLGITRDISERKRAEERLRENELWFRALTENSSDLTTFIRPDGLINYQSPSSRGLLGYTAGELVGRNAFEIVHPEDHERTRATIAAALAAAGVVQTVEHRLRHKDGGWREFESKGTYLPELDGIVANSRDVTSRKQTEESLRRANQALKTLSACNAALVHAQSELELLQEICRVIVVTGGYAYAWIGYAEHDEARRIKPMAQMGFENGFLDKLPLTWSETERGQGPAGTAVREGMVMVARDAPGDPTLSAWRDVIAQLGLGSGCAFPLMSGDDAFGALSIYARERGAFDKDELMLLAELADDLNFGILTLRTRAAHERLQEEHLKSAERLRETLTDTIRAVALTVEKRDPYTAGHQNKVAELCVAIGRELGLDEDRLEGLRLGATIHDIGKVYIPAEILNRPGKLSSAEFEIIKSHPEVGYDIIKDIKFPWPVGQLIMQHHERLDGSGYPKGLKGDEIILEARILAVADTVEAMTSHRPYRAGLGLDAALAQIQEKRGTWYDPAATDACVRLFRERGFQFEKSGQEQLQ